jgi:threonine dehydrogenase-like Zn-dependent dehydrogenase
MHEQDRAAAVLEHMRVSGPYPNTYFIGSKSIRLTFLSQQVRAFNLIWALQEKRCLGKSVAVIGGGLAGMTAALAAQEAGAAVTLYERKADLLHLQRGCQLRFIHPNVYDWPDPESSDAFTRLPWPCASSKCS